MKKLMALALASALAVTVLAGCGGGNTSSPATTDAPKGDVTTTTAAAADTTAAAKPVDIRVVSSYGGDDGNRANYEKAFKAYEAATGNTVKDNSGTANEEWKAKQMTDFQAGAEPDVFFYFSGLDSTQIVNNKKVVSLDDIRAVYPDYASNMNDSMIANSPADGKKYVVPVNGYWEGLFVNKKVLADCGVEVPGKDTTWDQFMADCKTIAAKGYTPIAMSAAQVPNYWFEFLVFNQGNTSNHAETPASSTDAAGKRWAAGLMDFKTMFEANVFPKNTLTANDPETFQLMADGKAAFASDGSWKCGWFAENALDHIEDYTVTYVPSKGERKPTDIISGMSMGYYITTKAWNDPTKQKACVDFVTAMTTDEVVSSFGATSATALKKGTIAPDTLTCVEKDAIAMCAGATGIAPATQDGFNDAARAALFADVKNIMTGKTTAEAAIDAAAALNK